VETSGAAVRSASRNAASARTKHVSRGGGGAAVFSEKINLAQRVRRLTACAEKVAGSILAKLQLMAKSPICVFAVFNAHCEKQKQRVVAYIHS